jgi:hypothetical protein
MRMAECQSVFATSTLKLLVLSNQIAEWSWENKGHVGNLAGVARISKHQLIIRTLLFPFFIFSLRLSLSPLSLSKIISAGITNIVGCAAPPLLHS